MNSRFARIITGFVYPVLALTFGLSVIAQAQTIATATNLGANQFTLNLTSPATGRGYFTLLTGSATCGTAAQTVAGQDSTGAAAARLGSLPLTASVAGSYTVRNLAASTAYNVCFTPDGVASPIHTTVTTDATVPLAGRIWQNVGPSLAAPDGDTPSLAFAPDGTPYVGVVDLGYYVRTGFTAISGASVWKYNGSTPWLSVGLREFSRGEIDEFPSLAFAPDGTPYLAYVDESAYSSSSGGVTVMKFDGSAWVDVGMEGFSSGVPSVFEPQLAFGPDGTPYVAFADGGYNYQETVMKFDGSKWVVVGNPGFTSDGVTAHDVFATSFALALDGTPYLSYGFGTTYYEALGVIKYDGTAWVPVGPRADYGGPGIAPALIAASSSVPLAFAPDGTPYVAYQDATTSDATVLKYTGSAWTVVGNTGITGTAVDRAALAIAPDGAPYLAYNTAPYNGAVMTYNGSTWVMAGDSQVSPSPSYKLFSPEIAFAPDGTPNVTTQDADGVYVKSLQAGHKVLAPQTITFSPTPAAVPWNTGVQLAANGGASGEPVIFSVVSGPGVIAQPGLGVRYPNMLTFTRGGTVVIAANQAGNFGYTAAPRVTETIVAKKLEQDITFLRVGNPAFPVCGSSDGTCVYGGAPILVNPRGGGSFNPVTCTVRGPGIVTNNCGPVQITGAGSITVAAHQKGNDQYLPAGLAEIGFYVQKASQAITFDPLPSIVAYGSGPLTLHATGGGSGNPVTFTVKGPGTIVGDQLYITGTGSVTVSAYQRGNENYTSAGRVAHGIYVQKP